MSYSREYYLKHKEEYKERNKKWREENKEKFYKIVYRYRTKKAEELKAKGEMYCWHTNNQRKKLYEERNRRINKNVRDGEIQDNSNKE